MALRKQQNDLLKQTNSEFIEFKVFDKDGTQKSNETKDVLISCPTVLRPINENLAIEYIRPIKEAIKTTNINPLKLLNYNPTFRYSTYNWNFGSLISPNKIELLQPNTVINGVNPVSGLWCLSQKFPETTEDKTNHIVKTVLSQTVALPDKDIEIGFSYYVQDIGSKTPVRYFISIGADSTGNGTIDLMYDFNDNKFSTGTFTDDKFFKSVQVSGFNRWHNYKTTLQNVNFNGFNSAKIEVKLHPLSTTGTTPGSLDYTTRYSFIDVFYIAQKTDFKKLIHTKTNGFNTEIFDSFPVNTLTGEYKLKDTFLTNEIDDFDLNMLNGFFGRADRIENIQTDSLDKIILIEILNDYREPVKKYEGDFYRNDAEELPIYFYNKVWVNFGESVLQDVVAAMIDSMEYDVKKNIYRINMHLPNIGKTSISLSNIFEGDDVNAYDKFKFN